MSLYCLLQHYENNLTRQNDSVNSRILLNKHPLLILSYIIIGNVILLKALWHIHFIVSSPFYDSLFLRENIMPLCALLPI